MTKYIIPMCILIALAAHPGEAFEPAMQGNDSVKFAVISDPHIGLNETNNTYKMYHYNDKILEDVVNEINGMKDIKFVLVAGDLTKDSEPYNHKRFLKVMGGLKMPYYITPGNHDIRTKKTPAANWGREELIKNYPMPWYNNSSLWYGVDVAPGFHLVSLDSSNYTEHPANWNASPDPELAWLDNDLAKNKNDTIIVLTHRALNHHEGVDGAEEYVDDAAQMKKILRKYGVHLAFTGHLHITDIAVNDSLIDRSNPATCVYPLAYTLVELNSTQVKINTIWYNNQTVRDIAKKEAIEAKKNTTQEEGQPTDRNATFRFDDLAPKETLVAASPAASQVVFVQMSDVHLSDKKFKDYYFGNETNIDPIAFLNMTVQEIMAMKPDFVVVTGDLMAISDSQDANIASKVFSTYNDTIQPLILAGIPVHEVLGNHDVVGVNNKTVKTNETGYGKALFLKTFGLSSTYYSFDQEGYHFVVLDPNNIDNKWNMTGKGLNYAINDTQLSWLTEDLSETSSPVIVFIHEAVQNLKNPENLSKVLKTKNTERIFSGHWHENELLNASGISEQNSAALSAAWWQGPHTDGSPEGYRVVVLSGSRIDSFYKAAGAQRQINIVEPAEAIVTGEMSLKAQIWSNSTIRNASYRIDNSSYMPMALSHEGIWYAASAGFDASQLSQGYHIINVNATDGNATFSKNASFKVSDNKTLEIGELLAHYNTYMGKHVTVKGVVTAVFQNGNLIVIRDATGGVHIYIGDSYQPPKFATGELWTVTAKVGESSGMSELKLIKSADANKSKMSAKTPEPVVKKATDIGSSTVGLLVQVKEAKVSLIDKDQSGFTIQDSTGKAYVYGNEAKYNTTAIKAGDIVDVTGIGQQNKRMYEVTLRNSSDVIVHKK